MPGATFQRRQTIAAAKPLRDKGITDFIILERGDDFGGT